ncbi:hypothetical protein BABINDRAFT_169034 [Babjeviella inositovora NRRL Y-12698]|uniref:Uncharacterized protein n=1 Tax=Babjeviella inositovora NRRL Y-12698 TaxID=984486 RepID=A0A1E3QJ55_9ASCO|nr:uncharacterized protein BABINDRAFT_169034 [Babjeviella inositovora NRRL Y-12698]ODQ77731.1 hypothetical protein BABINDRAFT_169034 [Babjeviella inositovora NRRL Y-12698]
MTSLITSSLIVSSPRPFDERLTTRLTRNRHQSVPIQTPALPTSPPPTLDLLRWLKLAEISQLLYSESFRLQYGEPALIQPSPTVLCVGTAKGFIVVFNYSQQVKEIIGGSMTEMRGCGSITSLAVLSDSTHVAAGTARGDVVVWKLLKLGSPVVHIAPITAFERQSARNGHLAGIPVTQLGFVANRHTFLVLADTSGLVFSHSGSRGMLGLRFSTRKILGIYDAPKTIPNPPKSILACLVLPLGTALEPTDEMGLTAVMSHNVLAIVSLHSPDPKAADVTTHYKMGKPRACNEATGSTGCLAWYPAITLPGARSCVKLVYCWSNVLTVVKLEPSVETPRSRDKDPKTVLTFTKIKRYVSLEAISEVQWINHRLVAAVTVTQQMLLIDVDETTHALNVLESDLYRTDLLSMHIQRSPYPSSFRISKGKFLLLGKREMFVGVMTTWTDRLMAMVVGGDHIAALEQARVYYMGKGDTFAGLPEDGTERRSIVREYLIEIMNASIEVTFGSESDHIYDLLRACFRACVTIEVSTDVYDHLFEVATANGAEEIFFDVLEWFAYSSEIVALSPTILQRMVEVYIEQGKGEVLEEIICFLDIEALDIDLTVQLCRKHRLRDTLVYIWNVSLCDYITPLIEFIEDVKREGTGYGENGMGGENEVVGGNGTLEVERPKLNGTALTTFNGTSLKNGTHLNGSLTSVSDFTTELKAHEQKLLSTHPDCNKVFSYISFVLTGRQYPTEKPIVYIHALQAKLNIYYVLFSGIPCIWPPGGAKVHILDDYYSEPAYPYLCLFLSFNCADFLAALNEAFEDSVLDDEEEALHRYQLYETKMTRQYIVDILLDVFGANNFGVQAQVYFAIFITRNYSKFPQFIRIADSVLEEMVEKLCAYPDESMKSDSYFETAGFTNVLFDVYRAEGNYASLLELYLASEDGPLRDAYETPAIVELCLSKTVNQARERSRVEEIIRNSFAQLPMPVDVMVKVFDTFDPNLHHSLFLLTEDQQFLYLRSMFLLLRKGKLHGKITAKEREAYIKGLCVYERPRVHSFVASMEDGDVDLNVVLKTLKAHRCMDSVVTLLRKHKQTEKAFEEITGYFETLKPADDWPLLENEARGNLRLGIQLCVEAGAQDEEMWLALIRIVVNLLPVNEDVTPAWTALTKGLVETVFRSLIDCKSQLETLDEGKASFLHIFSEFLGSASSQATTLGDVRAVLLEVSLAYSFEREMLNLTLKSLNDHIYKDMRLLDIEKVKGWLVEKNCAACGKPIWGKGTSNENLIAWEDKTLNKIHLMLNGESSYGQGLYDPQKFHSCVLVVFKCHHGYHSDCLASLVLAGEYQTFESEFGSYVNPNPRSYERCDGEDLVKLSACANEVLSKLDDCKPDDLACECCALQSMKQECFGLCPGSPNGSFLAVLYQDCESLNDINACGLPFKKDDNGQAKVSRVKSKGEVSIEDEDEYYNFKSKSKSKSKAMKLENSGSSVRVKSNIRKTGKGTAKSEWVDSDSKVVDAIIEKVKRPAKEEGLEEEGLKEKISLGTVFNTSNTTNATVFSSDESKAGKEFITRYLMAISISVIAYSIFTQ